MTIVAIIDLLVMLAPHLIQASGDVVELIGRLKAAEARGGDLTEEDIDAIRRITDAARERARAALEARAAEGDEAVDPAAPDAVG